MAGPTYDTGALIAAEKNERRMWGMLVLSREARPTIAAGVLAKAYRRQHGRNERSAARPLFD